MIKSLLIDQAFASDSGAGAAIVLGVTGVALVIWITVVVIALAIFIFWLIMLLDCIKRQFPGNEKTTWILVLAITFIFGFGWIGALIYLFAGRQKGKLPEQSKEVNKNH